MSSVAELFETTGELKETVLKEKDINKRHANALALMRAFYDQESPYGTSSNIYAAVLFQYEFPIRPTTNLDRIIATYRPYEGESICIDACAIKSVAAYLDDKEKNRIGFVRLWFYAFGVVYAYLRKIGDKIPWQDDDDYYRRLVYPYANIIYVYKHLIQEQ